MKERPILFSGPMVLALLAGSKTQTRRIVKPQPEHGVGTCTENGVPFDWVLLDEDGDPEDSSIRCPYGAPGDRIWVKETFAGDDAHGCVYRADHPNADLKRGDLDDGDQSLRKWCPSSFMPRAASRILLEVTSVRVELLHDIGEEDAIAEGLIRVNGPLGQTMWEYSATTGGQFSDPRVAYRRLWETINGVESWAENPWVWVVGFKR